jgi:hypothetical protein
MNETAFPRMDSWTDSAGNHTVVLYSDSGITIRDYFAARAMQGLVANGTSRPASETAEVAYQIADAMIVARGEA